MTAPVITSCSASLDFDMEGLNLAKAMIADSASTATDIAASCPIKVSQVTGRKVPVLCQHNLTSKCIISSAIGFYNP